MLVHSKSRGSIPNYKFFLLQITKQIKDQRSMVLPLTGPLMIGPPASETDPI